jgi:GNAT superfamily N-acetyltransferase
VLVVKRRPHGAYRKVLVGDDFTKEARHGLEVAVHLFPDAGFTLMHAHEMAYGRLLLDSQLSEAFGEMERATIRESLSEAGATALLVTHDQHEAFALADEIGVLRDGHLVGFELCWTSGFIKDIAVAAPYRRQGVGEALLLAAFAALKARGNEQVGLKVETENPSGAQRLYERLGFVIG